MKSPPALRGALARLRQATSDTWGRLPQPLRRRMRWAGVAGLAGLAAATLVLLLAVAWLWPSLPPLDRVTNYQPRQHLQVLSSDGVELAQFGSERRIFTPIGDIPRGLQDALLAIEDARFREHRGIDWIGVTRAVLANLTGGRPQGASTITQQVARNFFLSSRRTLERKLKEALLAWRMERELSKDEILELYMNQIYLGNRAYGFGAAAQVYYGKTMDELSVAETAMLAGLPQNPSFANPIANPQRARQRQMVVLMRMRDVGYITPAQWAAAREEANSAKPRAAAAHSPAAGPQIRAEHVAEMARKMVYERYGQEAYTRGLKVTTSLVSTDQQAAWAAVRGALLAQDRQQPWRGPEDFEELPDDPGKAENLAAEALKDLRDDDLLRLALVLRAHPKEVVAQLASGETVTITGEGLRWVQPALAAQAKGNLALRRGAVIRVMQQGDGAKAAWTVTQLPKAQGAFVSLDPATGRVRALVGSFDFARQPFNHATQAWRQPGSTIKPFIYSAAFEHGVMPDTLVNDAPLENPANLSEADARAWNPSNADGQFEGPITVRRGLAQSKNLVSLRLLQHVGVGVAREWLTHFGFDAERQPDNLSLALGTGSTTPMQLAGAYAVLANGGYRVEPVVIERITDAQGQVLFEAPPAPQFDPAKRAVPERNTFLTRRLLQEATHTGTAARAHQALQRDDLYGKTGTTDAAADVWFAGFQPSVVAVMWMGHDEPRSLGGRASGASLALPAWIAYMKAVLRDEPVAADPAPDGVAQRQGVFGAGEWVYEEWAEGGGVRRIGLDDPAPGEPGDPASPFPVPGMPPAASDAAAAAPPGPARRPAFITPLPPTPVYSGN